MKIRKAVIPAGGLGTRFLPATKAIPKEMLPVVDTPTIQYIVEEAVKSGIEDIVIITGRTKRAIEDHFDKSAELEVRLDDAHKDAQLAQMEAISNLANMIYVRQKEPLGLGHAVMTAREVIGDEPFAVLLGDDVMTGEKPALAQLIEVFNEYDAPVVGVKAVPWTHTNKYGIIRAESAGEHLSRVEGLVEKPQPDKAPTNLAVMGRYVLTPEIFDILKETGKGVGGEIQLTDALDTLCTQRPMYAWELEGRRYDVGDKQGFLEATCEFALANPELKGPFARYLKQLVAQLEGEDIEQN
ncbi:MAG: UTP--glucose-1-phosphate uridylyltransferase GalU [Clostridia bacterium]|nr:UTP--glucose-1-phosphate uridylyltransferase GalU [Clostridia bacterium]